MKNIYELKFHESVYVHGATLVLRVPGGWIYTTFDAEGQNFVSSCFVPFDNEFQVTTKKPSAKYAFPIKTCPGYEGHTPDKLGHEVCKNCGSIKYYH